MAMRDETPHDPALPDASAPWWEDGQTVTPTRREPAFLTRGIMNFWQQIRTWLLLPLAQTDPLTCSPALLDLLAWERDITRFDDEPLSLYRRRVKYAFINAQDAGEVAGFIRIFERLGLGRCQLHERQPCEEWDVITVEVTDSTISDNPALMMGLIQQYGRTCRRYRFQVVYLAAGTLGASRFAMTHQVAAASLKRAP
ncbi:phage tail protein [Aeromonas enteropelogenes]|uniref:phage tail protein n=1 Tax=Aeromonas enteropelogenes TaxID=29489 RepID=UPI003BA2632B